MTTNTQAEEVLAKQIAEWRKEVARLNDLIAHAEGRDSQAASIDTPEFDDLLLTYWECRNHGESYAANERAELIAYIDGRLAQASSSSPDLANLVRYMFECRGMLKHPKGEFVKFGAVEEVIAAAPQQQEAAREPDWRMIAEGHALQTCEMEARVIAAESRLAEIQRGVEGLVRFDDHDSGLEISLEAGRFVFRHEVLALLQPQGQADTSGLPG